MTRLERVLEFKLTLKLNTFIIIILLCLNTKICYTNQINKNLLNNLTNNDSLLYKEESKQ